jgi:hypothetical protein
MVSIGAECPRESGYQFAVALWSKLKLNMDGLKAEQEGEYHATRGPR